MATTDKKRKLIDLTPEVERMLTFLAVSQGTNLKAYIERLLEQHAKEAKKEVINKEDSWPED